MSIKMDPKDGSLKYSLSDYSADASLSSLGMDAVREEYVRLRKIANQRIGALQQDASLSHMDAAKARFPALQDIRGNEGRRSGMPGKGKSKAAKAEKNIAAKARYRAKEDVSAAEKEEIVRSAEKESQDAAERLWLSKVAKFVSNTEDEDVLRDTIKRYIENLHDMGFEDVNGMNWWKYRDALKNWMIRTGNKSLSPPPKAKERIRIRLEVDHPQATSDQLDQMARKEWEKQQQKERDIDNWRAQQEAKKTGAMRSPGKREDETEMEMDDQTRQFMEAAGKFADAYKDMLNAAGEKAEDAIQRWIDSGEDPDSLYSYVKDVLLKPQEAPKMKVPEGAVFKGHLEESEKKAAPKGDEFMSPPSKEDLEDIPFLDF